MYLPFLCPKREHKSYRVLGKGMCLQSWFSILGGLFDSADAMFDAQFCVFGDGCQFEKEILSSTVTLNISILIIFNFGSSSLGPCQKKIT